MIIQMKNKILCPSLTPHTIGELTLRNHEEGDEMPWLARWDGSSSWWLFETEDLYALNIRGVERFRSIEDYIKGWDWNE